MHPVLETFFIFLRLGFTCFGGPIAHLGYFRAEFVTRRKWLDDAAFTNLIGLCQFLPGPSSSQAGFAIGLLRAGPPGALAAWAGFTLPSAALLMLFARYGRTLANTGILHGLKLAAAAIVAQAVFSMARTLCPDKTRAVIALAALGILLLSGSSFQIAALAAGALAGYRLCRQPGAALPPPLPIRVSRATGLAAFIAFLFLLLALPALAKAAASPALALFSIFYRAGALVFGGGHVVLPLLHNALVPAWINESSFMAGYGATQAVPGPLFTFAAYLGAAIFPHPIAGAALGLAGIFLPGMLILIAALPFWQRLRQHPGAQAALRGVNAAVVGLLAAALISPVLTSSVHNLGDAAIALLAFLLLTTRQTPPLLVVLFCAACGLLPAPP